MEGRAVVRVVESEVCPTRRAGTVCRGNTTPQRQGKCEGRNQHCCLRMERFNGWNSRSSGFSTSSTLVS